MTDEQFAKLFGGITQTLEKIDNRLTELEKKKALEIDPAKLVASTKDPAKLPKLTVVQPDPNAKSGVPGGKLEEPWADPKTARPPIVR